MDNTYHSNKTYSFENPKIDTNIDDKNKNDNNSDDNDDYSDKYNNMKKM